jgi:molybdopterin synthase catalytic subunit
MAALELGVRLFASVREAVGAEVVPVSLQEGGRVSDLLDALGAAHPEIASRRGALAVAVNHELAPLDRALSPEDEVALIPPVGGG